MPTEDIEWAVGELAAHSQRYKQYEDYFDGDQDLLFATEKFRNAFGNIFQTFAMNICAPVVSAPAERLRIQGWDGDNRADIDPIWKSNHMARLSSRVHTEALKSGDAYIIVWPNQKQKPILHLQKGANMCVQYDETDDDPNIIEMASKVWTTNDDFLRLNLYYPDHIEKYISRKKVGKGGGLSSYKDERSWEPFNVRSAGDESDRSDNVVPHGYGIVPVFHFANNADLGEYGTSELRDAIPLQDVLNKSVTDMMVDMEFLAFPQRWATGLQVESDEDTGRPKNVPFTPGADRIWSGGTDVKFGQFAAAEIAQYITAQEGILDHICRVTGVPPHFFNLQKTAPSGEALKVAEGRLVSKVIDRSDAFSDVWSEAMSLALEISGVVGSHEDADIRPVWQPPAPHNPLLDAETQMVLQQVGVSQMQSLRELGYGDDEIKQMILENLMAARVAALASAGPASTGSSEQGMAPGATPSAFTRNGSPGQASTPAPQSQAQGKGPVTGLKPGTVPATISPVKARSGQGQYVEGDEPS